MQDILEVLHSVNRCQIREMEKVGKELVPEHYASCETFSRHVMSVQAAIIHTYQIIASASIRQCEPQVAAQFWKEMSDFCNEALTALKILKEVYPHCGTPQLYDLALDYKIEADKRYYQNMEDAECAKTPMPKGLFPKMS